MYRWSSSISYLEEIKCVSFKFKGMRMSLEEQWHYKSCFCHNLFLNMMSTLIEWSLALCIMIYVIWFEFLVDIFRIYLCIILLLQIAKGISKSGLQNTCQLETTRWKLVIGVFLVLMKIWRSWGASEKNKKKD